MEILLGSVEEILDFWIFIESSHESSCWHCAREYGGPSEKFQKISMYQVSNQNRNGGGRPSDPTRWESARRGSDRGRRKIHGHQMIDSSNTRLL